MHAALATHRRGLEEQVHHHGLAAADLAVDVKPFDRRLTLLVAAEEPAERGRLARQAMHREALFEPGQSRCERRLRRVAREHTVSNEGRVLVADGSWHVWEGWLSECFGEVAIDSPKIIPEPEALAAFPSSL